LGQVGNQLAVALDNARLFENTQVYADDLAQRVSDRTRELEVEHNRSQTLLRIITELSASLDQDMVLRRTLAILNETIGAGYSMILLVNPEKGSLYLRSWLSETSMKPRGIHTGGWKVSEPLANWVVANSQAVLISSLEDDNRWPAGASERSGFHSAIAVPLLMGEECLGTLILFHQQKNRFSLEMLELAQAAAKQIAVSINNTQLFNLIRDQAERLGELLRSQHVETSRSQAMLEAVADGVLVTDAQRVITLFNASAEKILGLERNQIVGQGLENFLGLFGEAAQEWAQTIEAWSQNPNSRKPGESKSAQIELEDARVVSVHLSPVLLRQDFLGTVSIFQDITHRVELDRLKSEFVATVSHELRTPMTSIKGYVEILLMGAAGPLNDSQMRFLQVVRTNTDRLATLVNDLLDISRIEAGRVVLSWQPLEPQYLIRSAVDLISRRSIDEHRTMAVKVEIEDKIPPAFGDRERVQQILDNLVQNAYQYTPDDGQIIIRAQLEEDMLQFSVQDNGIGVRAEDHPRIFERFFRGEDPLVLATSGTGLGLSIVKHLVEMHGGKIWFESSGVPGLGSKFFFTIPLYRTGDSNVQMPLQQTGTGRRA
jgi:PAS domain S-box-containing protein